MNMSQLGISIEKHSFEERNCIKHLVRGKRSLNLSERNHTETAVVKILLG